MSHLNLAYSSHSNRSNTTGNLPPDVRVPIPGLCTEICGKAVGLVTRSKLSLILAHVVQLVLV
jgi:hypothetical protein